MFKYIVTTALVPSKSQLSSTKERKSYWDRLITLWGVQRRGGFGDFPGSNPRSVSRDVLDAMRNVRVQVALKSDGVRYILMLTTRPETDAEAPVALMIDRAANMFEVDVVAPEAYFVKGTVLEGELVNKQSSTNDMLFLVFDCVVSKGERFTGRPFTERIAEAHRCTRHSSELSEVSDDLESRAADADAIVIVQYNPHLVIQPKRFVAREHAAQLWAERNESDHRVDGLVLQDIDAPYVSGSCGHCLKWKEVITVDLRGKSSKLCCAQGPVDVFAAPWVARVDSESRIVATSDAEVLEYAITDVDADGHNYTLFALRSRPDKIHPNSLHVLNACLAECVDRINISDLCVVDALDTTD